MNTRFLSTLETVGDWDGQEQEAVDCWNHWVAPVLEAEQSALEHLNGDTDSLLELQSAAWDQFCDTNDEESFVQLGARVEAFVTRNT